MAYLQASAFRRVFGDVWYRANKDGMGAEDPVSFLMEDVEWKPTSVLEIGCANGWRLKKLQDRYGCEVAGLEPSQEAIKNGAIPDIYCGTAEKLPWPDNFFDTIIYGFCFGFIDPPDYFRVLAEGDRLLKNGGMVFLHDSATPTPVRRNIYSFTTSHKDHGERDYEVMLHHMDFSRLWLANPCYREITRMTKPATYDFVSAMQKDVGNAFKEVAHIPRDDGMQLTPDGHPIYPAESAA